MGELSILARPDVLGRRRRALVTPSLATATLAGALLLLVIAPLLPPGSGIFPGASALSERDTLIRFYHLAGGKHWTKSSGWKEGAEECCEDVEDCENCDVDASKQKHICSWHGVSCRSEDKELDDKITGIFLTNNGLSGKISEHLWKMPFLTSVDLRRNSLNDAGLQGFEKVSGTSAPLENLNLSNNLLKSLDGIKGARLTVEELRVDSNKFEGPLPEEIFDLRYLRFLSASYNDGLTGPLSPSLHRLENLENLHLSHVGLSGAIPTEIGLLTKVESITLDDSSFTGPLPSELGNLENLRYLSVNNEGKGLGSLTGTLPAMAGCSSLSDLVLHGNALTGTIPSNLLEGCSAPEDDLYVGLNHNLLTGKIPAKLGKRFNKLTLYLSGNRITGIPSSLCHKEGWMQGLVSQHGCNAILCPAGTSSLLGRAESNVGSGKSCKDCPNGEVDAPFFGSEVCNLTPVSDVTLPSSDHGNQQAPSVKNTADAPAGNSGGNLSGGFKFVIALVFLSVPIAISAAIWARRSQIETAGWASDSNNLAPKGDRFDADGDVTWDLGADEGQRRSSLGFGRGTNGDAAAGKGVKSRKSMEEELEEVEVGVVRRGNDGVDRCIL